jgi:hypothetical protein
MIQPPFGTTETAVELGTTQLRRAQKIVLAGVAGKNLDDRQEDARGTLHSCQASCSISEFWRRLSLVWRLFRLSRRFRWKLTRSVSALRSYDS